MTTPNADILREALRETVAKKLAANPGMKTAMLAETLGVPELDVLRVLPEGSARELDAGRMEPLLHELEKLGTIYLVVRNPGIVSESKGKFGEYSRSGPYLNVSTEKLHLHIMVDALTACMAVTVQGRPGTPPMLSLAFFEKTGTASFKLFVIESMKQEAGECYEEAKRIFDDIVARYAIA